MASPRTGSPNSVPLVHIQTDAFTLQLRGRPYHPTARGIGLHAQTPADLPSTVRVQWGVAPGNTPSVRVYNPPTNDLAPLGECPYPLFYENQDYYLSIRAHSQAAVTFHHDSRLIRDAVNQEYADLLSGHLNFRTEVGLTELIVRVNGQEAVRLCLEIFPAKLDYQSDYRRILHDIEDQVYNLAYGFLTRTFHSFSSVHTPGSSLTEFFSLFRTIFDQLVSAVRRIDQSPHHGLMRERRMVHASRVGRIDNSSLNWIVTHPSVLVPDGTGFVAVNSRQYSATKLPTTRKTVHTNTHENRFVRWMLERILMKLDAVKDSYLQLERKADHEVLSFLENASKQLKVPLQYGVLRDVNPVHNMTITLALQLSLGYRDIYRLYLLVMKGLQVGSDLFRMSLKDLATLYEYWCFLQLHSLLKQRFELINEDVVKVHRDGLFVTLNKTKQAAFKYRCATTGEQVTLVYNALPSHLRGPLPTVPQRPDTVLTILREGKGHRYSYIFDAKYRLNPALDPDYKGRYGGPGPEEGDINTMHRYRDAIVYADEEGVYRKSMVGAYVLFPYADEEQYESHQFYTSIEKVNIGGLPFLPGSTRLVEQLLDRILEL
ncbi:restriction endonuclease-like protein [Alicyclobacillus curvatus]|nr:restriction endonuclease-like protein [Alicyclobacillus curvatus]